METQLVYTKINGKGNYKAQGLRVRILLARKA